MTTPQKGRIFISYRRVDSEGYAGRIYDRLAPHFGDDAIFMDVDAIDAGVDFVKVLKDAVQSCDVLIALIGREWLNIKDKDGNRRLDNHEDFVRIEIAAALKRGVRVIPVLLGGVQMPQVAELPDDIKPLTRHNALQVHHKSFHLNIDGLNNQLARALKDAERLKILKAKKMQVEHAHVWGKYQEKIDKLILHVNTVNESQNRRLAQDELRETLMLVAMEITEEKHALLDEKQKLESRETEKRVSKTDLLKKQLQIIIDSFKKFFPGRGKLLYVFGGGVALLFLLGYIISNIELPARSEPTKASTPTGIIASPPPTFGVGSMMVSEKDGMTMVYVPAGKFSMGSKYGNTDEEPVHMVYLDAYWVDQTEVTNAKYSKCVKANACDEPNNSDSFTLNDYFNNYPVVYVSWNDADAYCAWAGRRLPTEAEWEKAANSNEGGQNFFIFPWGNEIDSTYANYGGNIGSTTEVGSYEKGKSFYGIYDMVGNVFEWVNDWSDSVYYQNSPAENPLGPDTGDFRIFRGGSWNAEAEQLRVANRESAHPSTAYSNIGFRCALSADEP